MYYVWSLVMQILLGCASYILLYFPTASHISTHYPARGAAAGLMSGHMSPALRYNTRCHAAAAWHVTNRHKTGHPPPAPLSCGSSAQDKSPTLDSLSTLAVQFNTQTGTSASAVKQDFKWNRSRPQNSQKLWSFLHQYSIEFSILSECPEKPSAAVKEERWR